MSSFITLAVPLARATPIPLTALAAGEAGATKRQTVQLANGKSSAQVRGAIKGDGNAATSAVRGYLAEASANLVAAIFHDYDAAGANTARRLVSVNVGTAQQPSRDVGKLISESEPYPGVIRLN
jgi:hypothetical protein